MIENSDNNGCSEHLIVLRRRRREDQLFTCESGRQQESAAATCATGLRVVVSWERRGLRSPRRARAAACRERGRQAIAAACEPVVLVAVAACAAASCPAWSGPRHRRHLRSPPAFARFRAETTGRCCLCRTSSISPRHQFSSFAPSVLTS